MPWARPVSGFTAAFEAIALCRELPERQGAALLRCTDKQLWRRIEFYVDKARALESHEGAQIVGIDETNVRREELRAESEVVAAALLDAEPKARRSLLRGMRKNPAGWTVEQTTAMHWLQRSALKSARAWRLLVALREVHARARQHNNTEEAASDLAARTSWARRCRLEPFKRLAATVKERFDAVVRGMIDHSSNACLESMNG